MKTNKKLFTATIAGAVVASSVVPVMAADVTTQATEDKKDLKDVLNLTGEVVTTTEETTTVEFEGLFDDVKETDYFAESVEKLAKRGVISGYPDGTYRPNQDLTRGQAAALFTRLLELEAKDVKGTVGKYTDVSATDYYAKEIAAVTEAGIFKGGDGGKFGANDKLTRAQMATIIVRAFDLEANDKVKVELTDLKSIHSSHREAVEILFQNGITTGKGDGTYGGSDAVTRGQFAAFLDRSETVADKELEEKVVTKESLEEVAKTVTATTTEYDLEGTISKVGFKVDGVAIDLDNAEVQSLLKEQNLTVEVISNKTTKTGVVVEDTLVHGDTLTYKVVVTHTNPETKEVLTATSPEFKVNIVDSVYGKFYKFKSSAVTTTQVDANTVDQLLGVTLDNRVVDLTDKETVKLFADKGVTVEFRTSKDVLADSATGKLNPNKLTAGTDFEYQVVFTNKETKEVILETKTQKVKVVDYNSSLKSVDKVELVTATGSVLTSNTVTLTDTVSLANIKGTTLTGTKEVTVTGATFKSSDETVAFVNTSGQIIPVKAGTATITIKKDDKELKVNVKIVDATRKATTVTLANTNVKLVSGATKDVKVTVKDQFGDVVTGTTLDTVSIVDSKDKVIAVATPKTVTNVKGEAVFGVVADTTNVGTGTGQIKLDNKVVATISAEVVAGAESTYPVLELVDATDDYQIDKKVGSDDRTLQVSVQRYDNGFYVGKETNIADEDTFTTQRYKVASTDKNVATVSVDADGVITVTPATKSGTTTIEVREGSIVRAKFVVTVVDSTPTITTAKFADVTVSTSNPLALADLVDVKDIVLSDGTAAKLDGAGVVYVDTNNDNTFTAGTDVKVGQLTATFNVVDGSNTTVTGTLASGLIGKLSGATAVGFDQGNKGNILVKFNNEGDNNAVVSKVITVDVK